MADPAFELVDRFGRERGRAYERAPHGGPLWDDGSDIAALLAIAFYLEGMIGNGGWSSVYYNRIGWTVPLAARGYRLLGMEDCAQRCALAMELVRKAEGAHPGVDRTSEEWLAGILMDAIDDYDWDRLDDGWSDLTRDTYERMAQYIREHRLVADA